MSQKYSGNDVKLIRCCPGHGGLTAAMYCAFERLNEAVSGGKPPAGKGVDSLLSWHGSTSSLYYIL